MSDTKKYIRIPKKDLPAPFYLDGSGNVYFARYRVISEDGGMVSRWSQRFEIPTNISGTDIALLTSEYSSKIDTVSGVKNLISTWNVNRILNPNNDNKKFLFENKFNVYARFYNNNDTDPWQFIQEVASTNFQITMPSGKNKADIAVLLPNYRGLDASNILEPGQNPEDLFPDSLLFKQTGIN